MVETCRIFQWITAHSKRPLDDDGDDDASSRGCDYWIFQLEWRRFLLIFLYSPPPASLSVAMASNSPCPIPANLPSVETAKQLRSIQHRIGNR